MSINRVTLLGNLTADAQVRNGDGWSIASFGVATSERWTTKQGEQKEETEFHNVELSNKPNIYQYLLKGQMVYIEGSIRTDKWTDQNGQPRETKKIRANIVQLCGSRNQQQNQAPQQPQYQQAPPPPPQQAYQQPQYQQQYQQPAPQQYAQQPQRPQYNQAPPQQQYAQQAPPAQQQANDDLPF